MLDDELNPAWREPELPEREPIANRPDETARVAAIDVGTNSTRLLVADLDPAYRPIQREMTITRLGYKVDETGYLDAASMERTVETIARYAEIATGLRAKSMRIAATSACRDASNRNEFFAKVRAAAGVEPEILSGEQEAATAFAGALSGIEERGPWLVVDIGGGSTEVVLGDTGALGRPVRGGRASNRQSALIWDVCASPNDS